MRTAGIEKIKAASKRATTSNPWDILGHLKDSQGHWPGNHKTLGPPTEMCVAVNVCSQWFRLSLVK